MAPSHPSGCRREFNASLETSACYLLDRHGAVLASSNRKDPDRFVGNYYSFLPYFKNAMAEKDLVHGKCDLVAVGKPFLANPDLVKRWKTGAALNEPDMDTFYTPGAKGFTDYPFVPQALLRSRGGGSDPAPIKSDLKKGFFARFRRCVLPKVPDIREVVCQFRIGRAWISNKNPDFEMGCR